MADGYVRPWGLVWPTPDQGRLVFHPSGECINGYRYVPLIPGAGEKIKVEVIKYNDNSPRIVTTFDLHERDHYAFHVTYVSDASAR